MIIFRWRCFVAKRHCIIEKRVLHMESERLKNIRLFLCMVTRLPKKSNFTAMEAIGHLAIGEYLMQSGCEVSLFSGTIFSVFDTLAHAANDKINVVGLYCDYENQSAVRSLSRRLKALLPVRVFIGGPQTVGLGEAYLLESLADALFRGEGEYQLATVLCNIADGATVRLAEVPGACFFQDGVYIDNGSFPPIRDLDALPPVSGRLTARQARTAMAVMSGRGCPFNCAFCYEGANSRTVRWRSIPHTMREIRARLASNPEIRYIFFGDDTFTLDIPRLQAFCAEMKLVCAEHDLVWFCDGHVNVIRQHPEIVPMLVDAGLVRMQIGIESCCQNVIDVYNKGIKREDLFQVVDICKKAGLKQLAGNIIVGGAFETRETLQYTFDTIYELMRLSGGMLDVSSTFYSNFPSTAISKNPDRFGLRVIDGEAVTSTEDWAIVETDTLSREDITLARKRFMVESIQLMRSMLAKGEITDQVILDSYRLSQYGLHNEWYSFAYSTIRTLDAHYKVRVAGNKLMDELSDVLRARPFRVLPLMVSGDYSGDHLKVGHYSFTAAEAEIYVLCAGKLTTRQIVRELFRRHPDSYADESAAEKQLLDVLVNLEKQKLLTFSGVLEDMEFEQAGNLTSESAQNGFAAINNDPLKQRRKVLLFKNKTQTFYGKNEYIPLTSMGIFYLTSWLNAKGYDAYACECRTDEVAGLINGAGTEDLLAVGFSVDFENRMEAEALMADLRRKLDVFLIAGGEEALSLGEDFLRKTGANAVVLGEGELALAAALDALRKGASLDDIKGLRFIDGNGTFRDTGQGAVIKDLDSLPFPDYDRSLRPFKRSSINLITSRGCPNRCAFCHEGSLNQPVRRRSVGNVLAEMTALLDKYPHLSHLSFCDDTFVTDQQWVMDFCAGVASLQAKRPFTFYCEADVPSLYRHPEVFTLLVAAGLQRMQIGIESGSPEVLKIYRKPITPAMVKTVVAAAKRAGLPEMVGCLLIGGPLESEELTQINRAYSAELLTIGRGMMELMPSILTPYPQTEIGRNPEKFSLTVVDAAGASSSGDYPLLCNPELGAEDIIRLYQDYISFNYDTAGRISQELSHDELLQCFSRSKSDSFWQKAVTQANPQKATYYGVLARGAAQRVRDIPPDDLDAWRPVRLLEIWRHVDFTAGFPRLGKRVLSPLEFEVLAHSTGKLTVAEITSRLWPGYGENREETRADFASRIRDLLLTYDARFQIVATPY